MKLWKQRTPGATDVGCFQGEAVAFTPRETKRENFVTDVMVFEPVTDELLWFAPFFQRHQESVRHQRHIEVRSSRRARRSKTGLSKRGFRAFRRQRARRVDRKVEKFEWRAMNRPQVEDEIPLVWFEPGERTLVHHQITIHGGPNRSHFHVFDGDVGDQEQVIDLVEAQSYLCTGFRVFTIK